MVVSLCSEKPRVVENAAPGLEIRVSGKAIVYCVDIRSSVVILFFVRPADTRTLTDPDFQSGYGAINDCNEHNAEYNELNALPMPLPLLRLSRF